jgi:hypothetical protein
MQGFYSVSQAVDESRNPTKLRKGFVQGTNRNLTCHPKFLTVLTMYAYLYGDIELIPTTTQNTLVASVLLKTLRKYSST